LDGRINNWKISQKRCLHLNGALENLESARDPLSAAIGLLEAALV